MAESTAPKRRRKKAIILGTLLVLLAGLTAAGFGVYRMMIGPAQGTVIAEPGAVSSPPPAPELEQFDGTYVSFVHPASYVQQPPQSDNNHTLETHIFLAAGMMSKVLTLTVTNLPSGRLEDDASYYMRSLHPEIYRISMQTIAGDKVALAMDSRDNQESAFWVHKTPSGPELLTFTLTTASINSQATGDEYQKMLQSVTWH